MQKADQGEGGLAPPCLTAWDNMLTVSLGCVRLISWVMGWLYLGHFRRGFKTFGTRHFASSQGFCFEGLGCYTRSMNSRSRLGINTTAE